jgi:hypothetical protein
VPPVRAAKNGAPVAGGTSEVTVDVRGWVRRNPYGTLAGAVGVGFVLGGGLFTRLAARFVGAGLRMGVVAAIPLLQDELLRGLGQLVGASNADAKKGR